MAAISPAPVSGGYSLDDKMRQDHLYQDNVWFKCAFSIPYLKLSNAEYSCSQFISFLLSPQALVAQCSVYSGYLRSVNEHDFEGKRRSSRAVGEER